MTTDYNAARTAFRWTVPARFNIAAAACDRWADGSGRLALIFEDENGSATRLDFDRLKAASSRLANVFSRLGLARGDRIAVLLAQSPETGIAHLAAYRAGAIAVPLFALFGPDALQYRLADSGARILVTDAAGYDKIAPLLAELPALAAVLIRGPMPPGPAQEPTPPAAPGRHGVLLADLAAAMAA
ncbi:MAG: AMP-binding protein, partial [Lautropia sp.]